VSKGPARQHLDYNLGAISALVVLFQPKLFEDLLEDWVMALGGFDEPFRIFLSSLTSSLKRCCRDLEREEIRWKA
jgi:hypothetical protein